MAIFTRTFQFCRDFEENWILSIQFIFIFSMFIWQFKIRYLCCNHIYIYISVSWVWWRFYKDANVCVCHTVYAGERKKNERFGIRDVTMCACKMSISYKLQYTVHIAATNVFISMCIRQIADRNVARWSSSMELYPKLREKTHTKKGTQKRTSNAHSESKNCELKWRLNDSLVQLRNYK